MTFETPQVPETAAAGFVAAESNADRRRDLIFDSQLEVAFMATDCKGLVTDWNDAAGRLFGWSAADMLGASADSLFTPQDRAEHRPGLEMQCALEVGRAHDERQRVRKDGSLFWGQSDMVPLRDSDGMHLGYFKMLRDTTHDRASTEALRADAAFLRSVLAASGDCIKVVDLDASLRFMSEHGQRLMEVSDFNAIRGCAWTDFWQGSELAEAKTALAAARAGGRGHFVGVCKTMAGTPKWWDVQVTPILGADGQPERLLWVSRDISEARLGEQLLAFNEQRLSVALGASGMVAAWDWDLTTGLVYGDENYARIYAFDTARAAAGAPLEEYLQSIHPEDVPAVRREVDRTLDQGSEFSCEYRVVRPDESFRWIFARGRLVRDLQGTPVRFAGTSVDITDRKSAELRHAFLLSLSDRLRVLGDPEALLAAAAQQLGEHLRINRVGFGQIQQDGKTISFQGGYVLDVEALHGSFPVVHFGVANIARMRQGLSVVCDDVAADSRNNPAGWEALLTRAFVAVPLVRDARFRGALYLNCRVPRHWQPSEVALIEDVAARVWDALERARAETELRISEKRLLGAVAITSLGVFEWNTGTNEVILSDRSREMFGFGPTEGTQAEEVFARIHPLDVGRIRNQAMRAALDADRLETSFRVVLPSGACRWIKSVNESMPATEIRAVRQIGVFEDVTDRVLAEQTLRNSELQFRTLAQSIPHQVWTANADGQLDWCNDRVAAYAGTEPGSVDGAAWSGRLHADDVAVNAEKWQTAVSTGQAFESELRLRRSDGMYRWHVTRAEAVRGLDGRIARWVGTSTDIDDQHAARESLTQLNLTLEARVEQQTRERDQAWKHSRDLQAIIGVDGVIVAVNDEWTALLGWRAEEVVGRCHLDFNHPEDAAQYVAVLAKPTAGSLPMHECRVRHKDGSYRWVSWASATEDCVVYASGRHVTAERQAAVELKATQEQLRQAQKMEAVGQLTGGVAHDFNNLLQVISANLQLMTKLATGNEKIERRLDSAKDAVRRGAKLSAQLLAFSRRQPLEPKVIHVGRFVLGMVDMVQRAIGEAIDIETVVSDDLWNTLIDPTQIENAVLNLAINGRDAMRGVGRLTLTAANAVLDEAYARRHVDVLPGDYVMLAVGDSGTGMTAEVMVQAFEPFFSTKPVGSGTGLGLSMVYGFVKQSGGHVEVLSALGHGTTMKLYLPRAEQEEDRIIAIDAGPIVGGSETILVAEDDEGVRSTVVELLSELGYRVLKAKDAASALTIIDSGISIDLLFTDVVMPGTLKSVELARIARQRLPGIAVLFTSGYTQNVFTYGDRLEIGVELLPKPYSLEGLARRVRQVLRNSPRADSARASRPASNEASAVVAPTSGSAFSVLLLEHDDRLRSTTIELLLDLGHVVFEARSAEEAMRVLQGTRIDLLITGPGAADAAGKNFAAEAMAFRPELRIVFAIGSAPISRRVDDRLKPVFLLKPYDSAGLAAALGAALA